MTLYLFEEDGSLLGEDVMGYYLTERGYTIISPYYKLIWTAMDDLSWFQDRYRLIHIPEGYLTT
jgi:hypothetical protein